MRCILQLRGKIRLLDDIELTRKVVHLLRTLINVLEWVR